MKKEAFIKPLNPALWSGGVFRMRSTECTPLYVTRYKGPRHVRVFTRHTYWEITVVLGGHGELHADLTHPIKSGTIVLVPPGVKHRERGGDALDTLWIGCEGTRFRGLRMEAARVEWNPSLAGDFERFWITAQQAHGEIGLELDMRLMVMAARLLHPTPSASARTGGNVVENVLQFMHEHMGDPLDLHLLAQRAGCSRGHFSRLFRAYTGQSVIRWLNEKRVQQAAHLLRKSDLSISEIADRVGIPDLFYFSRLFRKSTGQPPSRFRKDEIS